MKYRVIITPEAESGLKAACRYIRQQGAPQAARAWLAGARAGEILVWRADRRTALRQRQSRNLSNPFCDPEQFSFRSTRSPWVDVAAGARRPIANDVKPEISTQSGESLHPGHEPVRRWAQVIAIPDHKKILDPLHAPGDVSSSKSTKIGGPPIPDSCFLQI